MQLKTQSISEALTFKVKKKKVILFLEIFIVSPKDYLENKA